MNPSVVSDPVIERSFPQSQPLQPVDQRYCGPRYWHRNWCVRYHCPATEASRRLPKEPHCGDYRSLVLRPLQQRPGQLHRGQFARDDGYRGFGGATSSDRRRAKRAEARRQPSLWRHRQSRQCYSQSRLCLVHWYLEFLVSSWDPLFWWRIHRWWYHHL